MSSSKVQMVHRMPAIVQQPPWTIFSHQALMAAEYSAATSTSSQVFAPDQLGSYKRREALHWFLCQCKNCGSWYNTKRYIV
jgi:hypothetical protein